MIRVDKTAVIARVFDLARFWYEKYNKEKAEVEQLREALARLVEAIEAHVTQGYDESDAVFDARAAARTVLNA